MLRWLQWAVLIFPLAAQNPTATLVGRVTDVTGATIPQVRVEIINADTNEKRTVSTDEAGDYTLPNLAPGQYRVIVEKTGFRRVEDTQLQLEVAQTARLDVQLRLGDVSDSVIVTAEAPLLNTENAIRGQVLSTKEIIETPLDGRDFNDLSFLVPGVSRRAQGGQGSALAINGARGDNTNFIIDGFNDQNPRGGGAQARPPIDAMNEFKVQVSNYSAEYGRLAGGVITMVIKSGGNRPHGTLFEFLRNNVLDARNFFDVAKSRLNRNQYGAIFSGPVVIPKIYNGHDRTFFLFSWESYRQVAGQNRLGRVPTVLERAGDFSQTRDNAGAVIPLKDPLESGVCTASSFEACFPGNNIPRSRFSPVALKVLPWYPLPNRPGQTNNYITNVKDHDVWDSFLGKIDERITQKDSLSFRILNRENHTSNPFSGSDLGIFGTNVYEKQMLAGLNFTRIFTPATVNEFRAGMSRTVHIEPPVQAGHDYAADFGIPGTTKDPHLVGFPRFTVRDLIALGNEAAVPTEFTVNTIQWADTFSWAKKAHLIKFGADVLRQQFFQPANGNVRGTFNFLGRWTNIPMADFELGLLNDATRRVGTINSYLFQTNYGFFVQDDWKATPRLTVNLGLRYEYVQPLHEKYGRLANFVPEIGKLIIANATAVPGLEQRIEAANLGGKVGFAHDYQLPASLVYSPKDNFAPRIGFAWRPFGGTRTVIRTGYGIFLGSSASNPIRTDLSAIFPFTVSQTFSRLTTNPNLVTLSNPFPDTRGATDNVNSFNGYELHAPAQYLQGWNFTIEREIGFSTAIEIGYTGSKGTHLGRKYDINQPFRNAALRLPNGTFPRPYAGINTINFYSFGSNSSFHSAIATLNRRFSRGVVFRANYVYGKSIDDASQISGNSAGGYPGAQDSRNLGLERARSDWDNGHTFTLFFTWEIPYREHWILRKWQLAGSGRAYTGQPFTPRVTNVQLDQGEANRPDRIAKGTLVNPDPEAWFDLRAFPVVPLNSFRIGNSGRNILDGPGYMSLNCSLSRRFRVTDASTLQMRWEVFNAPNHTDFMLPNNDVNAVNGATLKSAGAARTMQFGLKYQF